MHRQLIDIVQGSVRSILSSRDLNEILQVRSELGEDFTNAVKEQLKVWGLEPVKNIELMDIRDGRGSKVIQDIMEKKKSFIEKESRIEVAKNLQEVKIAEIEAQKAADVKEQEQKTKEILGEADKNVMIKNSEAEKERDILAAEALWATKERKAQGIAKIGNAEAEAKEKNEIATVAGQISLAKEIGENNGCQQYLISIRQVEANQAIGVEQAKALSNGEIKLIVNSGDVGGGIQKISEIFTSSGGMKLGSMLEGLIQTDTGKALANKLIGSSDSNSDKTTYDNQ